MNRRSLFKAIAGLFAAPFIPFVKSKKVVPLSQLDQLFINDSVRMMAQIEAVMRQRGSISSLMKKGPCPAGLGETLRR